MNMEDLTGVVIQYGSYETHCIISVFFDPPASKIPKLPNGFHKFDIKNLYLSHSLPTT